MMALILSWGPNFVNLVGIHHGFGRHLLTLPVDSVIFFFKNLYAFGLFYCFAMASVKYSIIMFQYRIFPVVRYRRLLILCSVFVGCLTLSCALVSVFMCTPIHDFWDTKAGTSPGAKCINVSMYFIISGGINAGSDFVLLAMVTFTRHSEIVFADQLLANPSIVEASYWQGAEIDPDRNIWRWSPVSRRHLVVILLGILRYAHLADHH